MDLEQIVYVIVMTVLITYISCQCIRSYIDSIAILGLFELQVL